MNFVPIRILAVFLFVLGVVGATMRSSHGERVNYCQFGESTILLLVDRTTNYDVVDKRALSQALLAIYEDLAVGDRFIVHTIANDRAHSELIFDSCYPGCPDADGILTWALSGCRAGLARSDMLTFRYDLAGRLRSVLSEHRDYPYSAIIETLAMVMARYEHEGITRVVIFSDLLENSKLFPWPMIAAGDDATIYRTLSAFGLLPRLKAVPVSVFGVGRSHDVNRTPLAPERRLRLERFWRRLFELSGATSVSIGEHYR